ncbi:MAG: phosphatase PAP2 family protein [Chloroflexota bacterium]
MKRICLTLLGIFLGAMLSGCIVTVPATEQPPIEPDAAKWQTWVLSSSDALRPSTPPDAEATAAELAELQQMMAEMDAETRTSVAYWNAGTPNYRWIELAIERYSKGPPSPMVSRGLALLNVAIYDAVIASWDAKYTYNRPRPGGVTALIEMPASPSYPSEHAAAAGAASTVLAYLFPDEADFFIAQADAAGQSRLYAGVHYTSDVAAGLDMGRNIGEMVIARANSDGSDAVWTGEIPTGPDKWVGENPVFPLAGTWKPWIINSPDDYLPAPPPAIDSEQMQAELDEIKAFKRILPESMSAWVWHSFDRAYPWWYGQISTNLFEHQQTDNIPQAALMYATLAVTYQDTIISCFNGKYTYWLIRPSHLDSEITALFPVPPHPSYPSAHSCASMASAMVISHFFPEDAEMIQSAAHAAGTSRLIGGIHYASDRESGEILGRAVAETVLEHVGEMTGQ